jgi:hypothetical protein
MTHRGEARSWPDFDIEQLSLFGSEAGSRGLLEIFPAVWSACEEVIAPDASLRSRGIHQLRETGAARLSPLVAYVLSTRITDPDLTVRAGVVEILGDLFLPDDEGRYASMKVRQVMTWNLGAMRTRQIFALVEVVALYPHLASQAGQLLNACSYAGKHLVDIMWARNNALDIRRQAIHLIQTVGYLDAIPDLERLETKLEMSQEGQQSMPFAPALEGPDGELLPIIKLALETLRRL